MARVSSRRVRKQRVRRARPVMKGRRPVVRRKMNRKTRKVVRRGGRKMRNVNRVLGGAAIGGGIGYLTGGGKGAAGGALIGGGIGALTS